MLSSPSSKGFHICLGLQLHSIENQNRLHIIFDEKINTLHAHVNVPEKIKSEVRRGLKRSLRLKSSTLSTCKNEVLIRTALFQSLELSLRHRRQQLYEASSKHRLRQPFWKKTEHEHLMLCPLKVEEGL